MKTTQVIELTRNIKKTIITFLSISVITALGTSTYLGINYAAQGLRNTKNTELKGSQYRDFEIVSALGISQQNIEALQKVEGMGKVAGNYKSSGAVVSDKKEIVVNVAGIVPDINQAVLLDGNVADKSGECVVDVYVASKGSIRVGDKIHLTAERDGKRVLKNDEYVVTGIAKYEDSRKRDPYVLVNRSEFNTGVFDHCYTSAYVQIKGAKNLGLYGSEYSKLSDKIEKNLVKEGEIQAKERFRDIKRTGEKKLAEGRKTLEDAQIQLQKYEQQWKDGEARIKEGEKTLISGQKQIEDGTKKLLEGRTALDDALVKLTEGLKKLQDAKSQLAAGRMQLDEGRALLEEKTSLYMQTKQDSTDEIRGSIEAQISGDLIEADPVYQAYWDTVDITGPIDLVVVDAIARFLPEGPIRDETYASVQEQDWYQAAKKIDADIIDAKQQLADGEALYAQELQSYQEGLAEYNAGVAQYEEGLAEYNEKAAELAAGKTKYAQGQQELQEAKKKLEESRIQLNEKKAQFEVGQKEYNTQKKMLDSLKPAKWFVLGRFTAYKYMSIKVHADNLGSLGITFALTLILVAAMVCYASIERMIGEQRTLIGAQKALGFTTKEIMTRYMLYAFSSTLVGVGLGIPAAYFGVQSIALDAYKLIGGFTSMEKAFLPGKTIVVIICAFVVAILATWLACHRLLRLQAIDLMRDEVPKGGASILNRFRIWNRLPLFTKITISNMIADRRRVFTTFVGVTGCATLLVMGFSLKLSSDQIPEKQYGGVIQYDRTLAVGAKTASAQRKQIEDVLQKNKTKYINVMEQSLVYMSGRSMGNANMIGTAVDLGDYMDLRDSTSGAPLKIPEDGLLICKGIAEEHNLREGDSIQLMDSLGNSYKTNIGGVFDNYVWRVMVISPKYYETVFGEPMKASSYFIKLNGADEGFLNKQLTPMNGVTSYKRADATRSMFDSFAGTLNIVLILLIVMSAIMAMMILLNLAIMHVNQKSRELAIMRVNGFTLKEAKRYLSRDVAVVTIVGIVAGILLGSFLSDIVRVTLSNPDLQLIGGIQPTGCAIAAAITIGFTLVINTIAQRKVKYLKLSNVSANV